jgi:transcriptional regulator with XRE-family HTH domain
VDYSVIGKKIKELRSAVGLTQGGLAEDICTQALISRIEKGDIYPSATTLYQISRKLGVDVNYFFEIGMTPRLDYVKEVEKQLQKLRVELKYIEMMEVVRVEEKNPLFYRNHTNLQLLLWHKGIYEFEVKAREKEAFKLLHKALELTAYEKKAMSEREMQILSSLGVFEFNLKNYDKSMHYFNKVKLALKTMEMLNDKSIKTRLLYNMSRLLTRIGKLKESREHCFEAVNWCLEEEHLWGVGELYYQIGYNYELENRLDKTIPYIDKSILIFELRENHKYHSFLLKKKEELIKKLKSDAKCLENKANLNK